MTLPTSIHAFSDIPPILKPALAAGGATYRLANTREATAWRARAYRWRKLMQAAATRANNNIPIGTPYDTMRLTLDGPTVTIAFTPRYVGQLTLANGEVAEVSDAPLPQPPMPNLVPTAQQAESTSRSRRSHPDRSELPPAPNEDLLAGALNLGFLKGADE